MTVSSVVERCGATFSQTSFLGASLGGAYNLIPPVAKGGWTHEEDPRRAWDLASVAQITRVFLGLLLSLHQCKSYDRPGVLAI